MSKYLTLQNKALRQGMYVRYVLLPQSNIPYTTNGHIMVRGKTPELKPLKVQDDYRNEEPIVLTDKRWLSDLKDMEQAELEPITSKPELIRVGDRRYQSIYVEYIMAKYPVAGWHTGGGKLVALDSGENIIAIIAPLKEEIANDKV